MSSFGSLVIFLLSFFSSLDIISSNVLAWMCRGSEEEEGDFLQCKGYGASWIFALLNCFSEERPNWLRGSIWYCRVDSSEDNQEGNAEVLLRIWLNRIWFYCFCSLNCSMIENISDTLLLITTTYYMYTQFIPDAYILAPVCSYLFQLCFCKPFSRLLLIPIYHPFS